MKQKCSEQYKRSVHHCFKAVTQHGNKCLFLLSSVKECSDTETCFHTGSPIQTTNKKTTTQNKTTKQKPKTTAKNKNSNKITESKRSNHSNIMQTALSVRKNRNQKETESKLALKKLHGDHFVGSIFNFCLANESVIFWFFFRFENDSVL